MDWLPLIALGVAAFVATNLDDSLVLLLFFSDRRYRARHVFIGQALGIGALVLISLIGAALALVIPARWIGLLGLLPVGLGLKQLLARREAAEETAAPPPAASGWRRTAAVAGVAVANGGDNIGVYVPLFATRSPAEAALLLAVFAAMLLVWTFGGYYLARHSAAAGWLEQVSEKVMPWVLIGIGIAILLTAMAA